MLDKHQETLLDQYREGCVTLTDLALAFGATGVTIQTIHHRDEGMFMSLVKETNQVCERTGWPKLSYSKVKLY